MTVKSGLTIAHLSDPHLTSLHHVTWRELLNKRVLGYLSWRVKRRRSHSREVLSRTLADLAGRQPDHLVISGDFTHLGTAIECREAEAWLNSVGAPDYISIVPGNHDRYIDTDIAETIGRWRAWMQNDPGERDKGTDFPYLRVRGPVAIIGLSTAVPTPPFFASGRLGGEQLRRLDRLLETAAQRGLYRIVTLHHSPHSMGFRRGLSDSDQLLSTLAGPGAELVIHGHGHRQMHAMLQAGERRIPVFGVPSASASYDDPAKSPGYNVYEVNQAQEGWRTRVRSFILNEETQQFEQVLDKVIMPLSATTGCL